jgi:hypothetical protein
MDIANQLTWLEPLLHYLSMWESIHYITESIELFGLGFSLRAA